MKLNKYDLMKCKHCGDEVGEFYSDLEEHLWNEHCRIIMRFLMNQRIEGSGSQQK